MIELVYRSAKRTGEFKFELALFRHELPETEVETFKTSVEAEHASLVRSFPHLPQQVQWLRARELPVDFQI